VAAQDRPLRIESDAAEKARRAPIHKWVAGRGEVTLERGDQGSLRDELIALAHRRCIPVTASVEITLECNQRCLHCYNFDRAAPEPTGRTGEELRPDEVKSLLDCLAEAGSLFLTFTGGEPLLHPSLDDYIRHARQRRFSVKVKTNGTLLSAHRATSLYEAGALGVDLSIYGAAAESHDAFTGVPGSFERTLNGARNARRAGLDLRLNMTLHSGNTEDVERLRAIADGIDASLGVNPHIRPREDGSVGARDCQVTRDELLRLYSGPLRGLVPTPDMSPVRRFTCGCARSTVGVSSTGDVYPCIAAPVRAGNIRHEPFTDIWRSSAVMTWIRGLESKDFETCRVCPDSPYCRRSPGYVYSTTGNYTGPEKWTCMEAGVLREVHNSEPTC